MKHLSVSRHVLRVAITVILLMCARSAHAGSFRVIETSEKGWLVEFGPRTDISTIANPDGSSVGKAFLNATGRKLSPRDLDIPENYEQDKHGRLIRPKFFPSCIRLGDGFSPTNWSRDIREWDACDVKNGDKLHAALVAGESGRLLIKMEPGQTHEDMKVELSESKKCDKDIACLNGKLEKLGGVPVPEERTRDAETAATSEKVRADKAESERDAEKKVNATLVADNAKLSRRLGWNSFLWAVCLLAGLVVGGGTTAGWVTRRERRNAEKKRIALIADPKRLEELRVEWARDQLTELPKGAVDQTTQKKLPAPAMVDPEQVKNQVERWKRLCEEQKATNARLTEQLEAMKTAKGKLATENRKLAAAKPEPTQEERELNEWADRLAKTAPASPERLKVALEFNRWTQAKQAVLTPAVQALGQAAGEYVDMAEQLKRAEAKATAAGVKPATNSTVLLEEQSGARRIAPSHDDAKAADLERQAAEAKAKAHLLEQQLTEVQGSQDALKLDLATRLAENEMLATQLEQAEKDRDTAETEVEGLRSQVMNLSLRPEERNKVAQEISTLKEKLEGAVRFGILPKGKELLEDFFAKHDAFMQIDGRLKATQMPQPSDFDTIDREKARRDVAAKEQKRDALRDDVKTAFWTIFEYLKRALGLDEANMLGFFSLSAALLDEHRKQVAAKNKTLQPKGVDLAKVEKLVSRGQPVAAGAVPLSASVQDESRVLAEQGTSGADGASDDPVAGIMEMPPQSRVPTFSERSEMGEAVSSRELQAPPADQAPNLLPPDVQAAMPQANDQGPVIVTESADADLERPPLAPLPNDASGRKKKRQRGHRSEKIHTNPYGFQQAELAAAPQQDSPADDERPRITMPSPVSAPQEPPASTAQVASLPRPPGYTSVPPSAPTNPSTEPPDASEVRPKHELNDALPGVDPSANGPAKAEGG